MNQVVQWFRWQQEHNGKLRDWAPVERKKWLDRLAPLNALYQQLYKAEKYPDVGQERKSKRPTQKQLKALVGQK